MANGAAALHLVPAPESNPAASKPAAASAATAIQIGEAVADACEAIGRALGDVENGALLSATAREIGGTRIAQVVMLALDTLGEINFSVVARAEGCRVLFQRHGVTMRQQLGADCSEEAIAQTFDEVCGWVIAVTNQVVATELAFRSN